MTHEQLPDQNNESSAGRPRRKLSGRMPFKGFSPETQASLGARRQKPADPPKPETPHSQPKQEQSAQDEQLHPAARAAARFLGALIPEHVREDFRHAADYFFREGKFPDEFPAPPAPPQPETRPYNPDRARNALMALAMVNNTYTPEATLERETARMRAAGASEGNITAFQRFYVGEANDRLHAQTGPVMIAEAMRPVNNHSEACRHCGTTLRGQASAKIFGTKVASDFTLTLDRFQGNAVAPTVEIADKPEGDPVRVVFTEMDDHLLRTHDQEDDAQRVVTKLSRLGAYFDGEVQRELEQPRYRPPQPQEL